MLKHSVSIPFAVICLLSLLRPFTIRAAQIVFYVDGVTGGQPNRVGDIPVRDRLISLGHTVTTVLDSSGTIADTVGKDLIIISSSIQSGDMAAYATSSLRTLALPIIDYESALYDELLMGASGTNPVTLTSLNITSPSHPLAAGLSGTTTVYSSPNTMSAGVTGTLGNDATVVATMTTGEPGIFTYPAGGRLSDNTTLVAARRIGFFLNETGVPSANADSFKLLDAAVAYALVPEPGCASLFAFGVLGLTLRRGRRRL
jgi:hypothetical protein